MRDVIVYGYDWAMGSALEKVALGMARAGAKVLHCGLIGFSFSGPDRTLREIEPGLSTFRLRTLPFRLSRVPGMTHALSSVIAKQIFDQASTLGLRQPFFAYSNLGPLLEPLSNLMRQRGCSLLHVQIDYSENLSPLHVSSSDITVVFSRTAYHRMRARWGDKIHLIPHGVDLRPYRNVRATPAQPPPPLKHIPRPRLGYAGAVSSNTLNTRVLHELFARHSEWSFVSCQWRPADLRLIPAVPLPNAHVIPWQEPEGFANCVAAFDVGFMPYDCSNVVLFNGPPMKLWDYFALGLPVVATPLIHLWEYEDLVYLGETAKELESAVEKALAEPHDSPKRQRRKELAEAHSIEHLGRALETILS